MRKDNSTRGYAFLIVAIAIFIVAMLGITVLADFAIKSEQRQAEATRLAVVYRAIVGDPSKDTFGYLGDVGAYPTRFQDLFQSPGSTGWNGPYLSESLFNGSIISDSYGSPMEYDLNSTAGSGDELAIISKGPDHSSSNTASNPNDYTQFVAPPRPSAGSTYTSASGNADNITYPDYSVSPSTALQYKPAGNLTYNIVNKDTHQANAIVSACPGMYNVVATSHTRGSSDTITLPWNPGMTGNFLQGLWDVSINSFNNVNSFQLLSPYFSESVGVYPGRTVSHTIRVEDINSSTTPTFNLTIVNNTSVQIDVWRYPFTGGVNHLLNKLNAGATWGPIAGINACTSLQAWNSSTSAVLESWNTPWGTSSTHYVSSPTYSFTLINGNGTNGHTAVASHEMMQVTNSNDGVLTLGSVYQRQQVTFNNIDSGVTIRVYDQNGQLGNLLGTFVVSAANTTQTIY